VTKALTDQPLPEQMAARVAERVTWSKHEAKIGPWSLRVHPGTRWWDWTVNVDVSFGFTAKSMRRPKRRPDAQRRSGSPRTCSPVAPTSA